MNNQYPSFTPPDSLRKDIKKKTMNKSNFFTVSLYIPRYRFIIWSSAIATLFFIVWILYSSSYQQPFWSNNFSLITKNKSVQDHNIPLSAITINRSDTSINEEIHDIISMVDDIDKDLNNDLQSIDNTL